MDLQMTVRFIQIPDKPVGILLSGVRPKYLQDPLNSGVMSALERIAQSKIDYAQRR